MIAHIMPTSDDDERPMPFGIYGDTGELFPGLDDTSINSFVTTARDENDSELRDYLELKKSEKDAHRGVVGYIRDPNNLHLTGWGVIFGPSADDRVKEALGPLLRHREERVGDARLCRKFEGDLAPQKGESAEAWLGRQKPRVRMDSVNPRLGVPYYIMIVAPPDEISFEFQYSLDIFWAVGRIWFPNADEFRQYADSVVAYETMTASEVPTSRQMAVFGPC